MKRIILVFAVLLVAITASSVMAGMRTITDSAFANIELRAKYLSIGLGEVSTGSSLETLAVIWYANKLDGKDSFVDPGETDRILKAMNIAIALRSTQPKKLMALQTEFLKRYDECFNYRKSESSDIDARNWLIANTLKTVVAAGAKFIKNDGKKLTVKDIKTNNIKIDGGVILLDGKPLNGLTDEVAKEFDSTLKIVEFQAIRNKTPLGAALLTNWPGSAYCSYTVYEEKK